MKTSILEILEEKHRDWPKGACSWLIEIEDYSGKCGRCGWSFEDHEYIVKFVPVMIDGMVDDDEGQYYRLED